MINKSERMSRIENTLSGVSGVTVEVQVVSDNLAIISFDGKNDGAIDRLTAYFSGVSPSIVSDYDLECDQTCVHVSLR